MTQALRIFRKDFDYLRIEVAVFVLLAAGFAWMKAHIYNDDYSEPLLALAAAWLIARAVHADCIPGDRQFWLTRPYNRGSLIAAKLLFVAVYISLPVAFAELAVALHAGFTFREAIGPLLLSQCILFLFGALPVAALAALTSGIIPFILIALVLTLISMGGSTTLEFWFPSYADLIPGPVQWIRSTLFAIPIAAITVIVLVRQYRSRATYSGRVVAVAGLNLAVLVFLFVPSSFALKTQAWFSKSPGLAAGVTVIPRRSRNGATRADFAGREMMSVPLTLVVEHLPPDVEVRADDLVVSAFTPDRSITFMRQPGINRKEQENGQALFDVSMMVNEPQFHAARMEPLTIQGSVYMTLFGEDEKSLVSLRTPITSTRDGLRCEAARLADRVRSVPQPPGSQTEEYHHADSIICAALFEWPRKLAYAEAGDEQSDFSNTRISYAPFPAGFSLTPLEIRWSDPVDSDRITIVTRKPLAHFRRDFELSGVKFADFENRQFMTRPPPPVRPPARAVAH